MSFTTLTVTGTVELQSGAAANGAIVTLTLSNQITDGVTDITPAPITTTCNSSGVFSFSTVTANNDPTTLPTGTYYTVSILYQNVVIDSFKVVVPYTSAPSVDVFTLARLSPAPTPATTFVSSFNGRNGVVTLTNADLSAATNPNALAPALVGQCITRAQPIGTAALDLSGSNIGTKDPEPFFDSATGTYYVCYSRVTGTGVGNTATYKVGLASGSSFSSLTDLGILINTSTDAHTSAAGTVSGAGGSIIKDAGGTYHLFFSAVDNWSSITVGQTYHYTASAAAGPYTFHDVALATGSGSYKVDNSAPVFHNGQWVMLYINYPSNPASRTLRVATASSLNGPWSTAAVNQAGGGTITDAPCLFLAGGKLVALGAPGDYSVYGFDFSDHSNLIFNGLAMLAYGLHEINSDIRATVLVMPDGHAEAVYMGYSGSYYRVHSGLYGASRVFGATPGIGQFSGNVYNGLSTGSLPITTSNLYTTTGPNASDLLPPCTYAAEIMCRFTETSTFTAGEGVRIGPSWYSGEAYAGGTNIPQSANPWIPILGGAPVITFSAIGTLTSAQIAYTTGFAAWLPV